MINLGYAALGQTSEEESADPAAADSEPAEMDRRKLCVHRLVGSRRTEWL